MENLRQSLAVLILRPKHDQAGEFGRWKASDIGEVEIQGQQRASFATKDGGDLEISAATETLIENMIRLVRGSSQDFDELCRAGFVDLESDRLRSAHAAPLLNGMTWSFASSAA